MTIVDLIWILRNKYKPDDAQNTFPGITKVFLRGIPKSRLDV